MIGAPYRHGYEAVGRLAPRRISAALGEEHHRLAWDDFRTVRQETQPYFRTALDRLAQVLDVKDNRTDPSAAALEMHLSPTSDRRNDAIAPPHRPVDGVLALPVHRLRPRHEPPRAGARARARLPADGHRDHVGAGHRFPDGFPPPLAPAAGRDPDRRGEEL
jgi:hypothetical protein